MTHPSRQSGKIALSLLICIIIIILLVVVLVWWIMRDPTTPTPSTTTNTTNTAPTANRNTAPVANVNKAGTPVNLITRTTFAASTPDWVEEVWYQPMSAGGEVTYNADGVTFTGLQSNSRSGLMTTLEKDVTSYQSLKLHLIVTNGQETLTGTGYNGREAPVAVAISYLDAAGVEHQALGEDPAAAGQMFWRGFYTLDTTGQSKTTNGVKVQMGQKYTYNFDLMTLNPKPAKIHYVAVEGAGWKDRQGTVHELSLIGTP